MVATSRSQYLWRKVEISPIKTCDIDLWIFNRIQTAHVRLPQETREALSSQ